MARAPVAERQSSAAAACWAEYLGKPIKRPPSAAADCSAASPAGRRRATHPCRSLLLRNLLNHPEEEIRQWLFDPEPFELGRYLPAVIGRMIDSVAQHRPPRQREGSAASPHREDGVEPLRRQRRLKLLEASIGALQQPRRRFHGGQFGFARGAVIGTPVERRHAR